MQCNIRPVYFHLGHFKHNTPMCQFSLRGLFIMLKINITFFCSHGKSLVVIYHVGFPPGFSILSLPPFISVGTKPIGLFLHLTFFHHQHRQEGYSPEVVVVVVVVTTSFQTRHFGMFLRVQRIKLP